MSRFQSTLLPAIKTDAEAENEVRKAGLDLLQKINTMSSALLDYNAETPTGPDAIVATNSAGSIVLTVGDLTLTLGSVNAVNGNFSGTVSGATVNVSGLSASQSVQTDASKNLVSLANNGTGNNVLTDSPVFTTQITTPKAIAGLGTSNLSSGLSGAASSVSVYNSTNNALALQVLRSFSTSLSQGAIIELSKSKTSTVGTNTATGDLDFLGYVTFGGTNTTPAPAVGAYIAAIQQGAAGATNVASDLIFYTGTNAAAPVEGIRIYSGGEKVAATNAMITPQDIGTLSIPTGYQAFYSGAVTITSLTLVGTAKIIIVT